MIIIVLLAVSNVKHRKLARSNVVTVKNLNQIIQVVQDDSQNMKEMIGQLNDQLEKKFKELTLATEKIEKEEKEKENLIKTNSQQIDHKEKEINNLNNKINDLECIIAEKNVELGKLEKNLESSRVCLDEKIQTFESEIESLKLQIRSTKDLLNIEFQKNEKTNLELTLATEKIEKEEKEKEKLTNICKDYDAKRNSLINEFKIFVDEMTHSTDNHIVNFFLTIDRINNEA